MMTMICDKCGRKITDDESVEMEIHNPELREPIPEIWCIDCYKKMLAERPKMDD